MTKYKERNTSEKAIKKIKKIAKESNLDFDFVSVVVNLNEELDYFAIPEIFDNSIVDNDLAEAFETFAKMIGVPSNISIDKKTAINLIFKNNERKDLTELWCGLIDSVKNKNCAYLSEFANHYYLKVLNLDNINVLKWDSIITLDRIAKCIFKKITGKFIIGLNNIDYIYCDLMINLPYNKPKDCSINWLPEYLNKVKLLPLNSSINDLDSCGKDIVGGNNVFRARLNTALTYAKIIRVNKFDDDELFFPQLKNKLAKHFYSNDSPFPLNFWKQNGGYVIDIDDKLPPTLYKKH